VIGTGGRRALRAALRRPPVAVAAGATGALALVAAAGLAVWWWPSSSPASDAAAVPPQPVVAAPTPTPSFPVPTIQRVPPVSSVEDPTSLVAPPVAISIPDLGIDQRLIGLRVSPDGTMQVPGNGSDIGWWSKGPAPGEPGAAVLAGHVVLGGAPAVFARLGELADGAEVTVRRADGSVAGYRVTGREQFPKDDFPDDQIYRLDGPSALHLVTCGGEINPATGRYRDNVIVVAEPVSDTAPYATA
jgi:sortase (surface protein transpeptidase)